MPCTHQRIAAMQEVMSSQGCQQGEDLQACLETEEVGAVVHSPLPGAVVRDAAKQVAHVGQAERRKQPWHPCQAAPPQHNLLDSAWASMLQRSVQARQLASYAPRQARPSHPMLPWPDTLHCRPVPTDAFTVRKLQAEAVPAAIIMARKAA